MAFEVDIKVEPVWLEETDSCVHNTVDDDCGFNIGTQNSFIPKVENNALDPRTEDGTMDSYVHNTVDDNYGFNIETQTSVTAKVENNTLDSRTEDDRSMENYLLVSEITHLKEEFKSVLTEPGRIQVNTLEGGECCSTAFLWWLLQRNLSTK
ncbi:uncharacterized protein [Anabrus simplex]|uniref:uncharacterized protein isoform X3 n=1 Tax=Anabrus simplex TaxID=316456 RepID=UPI0034DCE8AA